MKTKWRKLGQIYDPRLTKRHNKLLSHAANPVPIHLESNIYRIFYSGRDSYNRSSVGAVDIDIIQKKIIHEHYLPFFEYGNEKTFFSNGVSIGNFYEVDKHLYMLFMGWEIKPGEHWRGSLGRILIDKNFKLSLDSNRPIFDFDNIDPISYSYPWVTFTKSIYQMWYGSTISWKIENGEMLHVINYACSVDGKKWKKLGQAIPYQIGIAQAFSRPTVIINNGKFNMWFSYRGHLNEKYRIGHATSEDGKKWVMSLDNPNITTSDKGWDSEMIEYPYVFYHHDDLYMLYNGNDYGKTGFGLAIYE